MRIERQLSGSACIKNRTWGTQPGLIWVESGCRAEFSYRAGRYNNGNSANNTYRRTVRCESTDGSLRNSRIRDLNEQSVRLERRLSSAACVNGCTWGTQPGLIWVESGCRAEFSYQVGGGYNNGNNGNNTYRRTMRCESTDGSLRNCRIYQLDEQSVRLERQLSSTACVKSRTWGTMPGLIWVESGCRAEFSYQVQ